MREALVETKKLEEKNKCDKGIYFILSLAEEASALSLGEWGEGVGGREKNVTVISQIFRFVYKEDLTTVSL